jgi:hypothetical protein
VPPGLAAKDSNLILSSSRGETKFVCAADEVVQNLSAAKIFTRWRINLSLSDFTSVGY